MEELSNKFKKENLMDTANSVVIFGRAWVKGRKEGMGG